MNLDKAVISGDIVAFTSLSDAERSIVEEAVKQLLIELENQFKGFSRIIKGDYLEYYLPNPKDALRVALAVKCFIKAIPVRLSPLEKKAKLFKMHGIRLAIGIGKISRFNPDKGIIDGEAIYFSGRTLEENASYNKGKSITKKTLFIKTNNENLNSQLEPLFALLDVLLSKSTAKQSEVIYLKLLGNNEEAIAEKMKIIQSTVNQHSTSAGWNAIEQAVLFFEKVVQTILE